MLHQPDWRDWSFEEKNDELAWCEKNPVGWMARWYTIVDKHQRSTCLGLNQQQMKVRAFREKHGWIAHGKARKKGITTERLADMVHKSVFEENKRCIVLAQTDPDVRKLGEKVVYACKRIPRWMVGDLKYTANGVRFPRTESWVRWQTYKREDRGADLTDVLYSEAALFEGMTDVFNAVNGSLVTKQPGDPRVSVEIESTGRMGPWEQFWNESADGYQRIFIPWHDDCTAVSTTPVPWEGVDDKGTPTIPEWLVEWLHQYQAKHKVSDEQLAWWFWEMWLGYGGSVYDAMQENPGSEDEMWKRPGDPFFSKVFYGTQNHPLRNHIGWLFFDDEGRSTKDRPKPTPGRSYVMGVDSSSGSQSEDADWGGISVHDCTDRDKKRTRQVAGFKAKMTPQQLAFVAWEAAKWWGRYLRCEVVIETNKMGADTQQAFINLRRDDPKGKRAKLYVRKREYDKVADKSNETLGFWTDAQTRPVALGEYRSWLDNGWFILNDPRQQMEHNTFIYNEDQKAEAADGCHDDGVDCNWQAMAGYKQASTIADVSDNENLAPTNYRTQTFGQIRKSIEDRKKRGSEDFPSAPSMSVWDIVDQLS